MLVVLPLVCLVVVFIFIAGRLVLSFAGFEGVLVARWQWGVMLFGSRHGVTLWLWTWGSDGGHCGGLRWIMCG